jgi:TPR repeat protein
MCDHGRGVQQDSVEAVHWYEKAARQGDTKPQYHLGAAYTEGQGVSKNCFPAYVRFQLALADGSPDAIGNGDAIAATPTPDELAHARQLASKTDADESWVMRKE